MRASPKISSFGNAVRMKLWRGATLARFDFLTDGRAFFLQVKLGALCIPCNLLPLIDNQSSLHG